MSDDKPYYIADALHVHGQGTGHDPVFIVGPRAQLLKLREALDKALGGEPQSAVFFAADGEGYRLVVIPVEDTRDAVLPYFETEGATWEGRGPIALLGAERYRALLTDELTAREER